MAKTVYTIYNDDIDTSDLSPEEMEYMDFDYFSDMVLNLKFETDNQIICIADLGLWNGRRSAYKICNRLFSECLTVGNHDYNHLYYDGYNVRKTSIHHDGTNHYLFREIKPGVNIEKFCNMLYNNEPISNATLNRYTKSLKKYAKRYLGH